MGARKTFTPTKKHNFQSGGLTPYTYFAQNNLLILRLGILLLLFFLVGKKRTERDNTTHQCVGVLQHCGCVTIVAAAGVYSLVSSRFLQSLQQRVSISIRRQEKGKVNGTVPRISPPE